METLAAGASQVRGEPVRHPRRIGRHVAIVFAVGHHELTVRCACTPQDEGDAFQAIRQSIQREVARALERVGA